MATVKIQVTQAGWSVEVETEDAETTQRIARTFIEGRTEIEKATPGYLAETKDLEGIPGIALQANGKDFPEDAPHEAETLSD